MYQAWIIDGKVQIYRGLSPNQTLVDEKPVCEIFGADKCFDDVVFWSERGTLEELLETFKREGGSTVVRNVYRELSKVAREIALNDACEAYRIGELSQNDLYSIWCAIECWKVCSEENPRLRDYLVKTGLITFEKANHVKSVKGEFN